LECRCYLITVNTQSKNGTQKYELYKIIHAFVGYFTGPAIRCISFDYVVSFFDYQRVSLRGSETAEAGAIRAKTIRANLERLTGAEGYFTDQTAAEGHNADDEDNALDHGDPLAPFRQIRFHAGDHKRPDYRTK
jgi:hypothetical protein